MVGTRLGGRGAAPGRRRWASGAPLTHRATDAAGPIGSAGAIRARGAIGTPHPREGTRAAVTGTRALGSTSGANLVAIFTSVGTATSYTNEAVTLNSGSQNSDLGFALGGGLQVEHHEPVTAGAGNDVQLEWWPGWIRLLLLDGGARLRSGRLDEPVQRGTGVGPVRLDDEPQRIRGTGVLQQRLHHGDRIDRPARRQHHPQSGLLPLRQLRRHVRLRERLLPDVPREPRIPQSQRTDRLHGPDSRWRGLLDDRRGRWRLRLRRRRSSTDRPATSI